MRFDQILRILCTWTLLFLASWSTAWMVSGPGPSFPFSLVHFTPVSHSSHLSGKAIPWGWGCWEQGVSPWVPRAGGGGQLVLAQSPHHQPHPHWHAGTSSVHRVRMGVQINGSLARRRRSCDTAEHTSGRHAGREPQLKSSILGSRRALAEVFSLSLKATSCPILKPQELLGALQNLFQLLDQGLHPAHHRPLTLTFMPSSLLWSSELPHLLYASSKLGSRQVTLSLLQGQLFPSPLLACVRGQVVL